MVNKSKKSSKPATSDDTTVVRIKAGAATSSKKAAKESTTDTAVIGTTKPVAAKKLRSKKGKGIRGLGVFRAIGRYFKGAWTELRQVRWPNRRATWSLTGAVLAYSAFFVVLVLLLDAGFKYLFELILGK